MTVTKHPCRWHVRYSEYCNGCRANNRVPDAPRSSEPSWTPPPGSSPVGCGDGDTYVVPEQPIRVEPD